MLLNNNEKLFKVIGSIFFISLMLTLNSFKEAKFNSTSDLNRSKIISRLLFAISETVSKHQSIFFNKMIFKKLD